MPGPWVLDPVTQVPADADALLQWTRGSSFGSRSLPTSYFLRWCGVGLVNVCVRGVG